MTKRCCASRGQSNLFVFKAWSLAILTETEPFPVQHQETLVVMTDFSLARRMANRHDDWSGPCITRRSPQLHLA